VLPTPPTPHPSSPLGRRGEGRGVKGRAGNTPL